MKWNRNIKRILLFILIFVGLNEGVKLYFFKVSVRNHKLIQGERQFRKYEGALDYIVLGHSRAARAIDTAIIEGSYSYCSGSESNVESYYKLKDLLKKHHDRIKNIILPIGLTSVSLKKPSVNLNSFYWSKYVDYLELAKLTGDNSTYWSIYAKTKLVPYYEYPQLRTMLANGELLVGMKDSTYKIATDKQRSDIAYDIVVNQSRYAEINDPVAQKFVQKTIDLVNSYGKNLIYVKFPITRYYAKAVAKHENARVDAQLEIEKMINESSSNVYLFDFENLFREHPKYFRDVHHLNIEGKEAFSLTLKKELEKIK